MQVTCHKIFVNTKLHFTKKKFKIKSNQIKVKEN